MYKSLERKTYWRARSPGALSETLSVVFQEQGKPPMSRQTERKEMQGLNTRLAGVIDKVQGGKNKALVDKKPSIKDLLHGVFRRYTFTLWNWSLQVRQLQTENVKMRRKKSLLEEYKKSDISKLKVSYEKSKEDLKTAIEDWTKEGLKKYWKKSFF